MINFPIELFLYKKKNILFPFKLKVHIPQKTETIQHIAHIRSKLNYLSILVYFRTNKPKTGKTRSVNLTTAVSVSKPFEINTRPAIFPFVQWISRIPRQRGVPSIHHTTAPINHFVIVWWDDGLTLINSYYAAAALSDPPSQYTS